MNEMIERVARAIILDAWPDTDWDYVKRIPNHPLWTGGISHARVAIAAMREPTDEMVNHGSDTVDSDNCYIVGERVTVEVWQTMIDQALRE